MIEQSRTADTSDEEWDEFVAAHPDGHHEQSSAHGRSRTNFGFQVGRVVVRHGGRIAGGMQFLTQRTLAGTLALVLRAPLAADNDALLLALVIEEFDRLAERASIASIRVELLPTQSATLAALENQGFHQSAAWFGERRSLAIPLALGDTELLQRMKPKGRYNIRVAERSGVTVHRADATALDNFYALHLSTAFHQGFPVFPREYFDHVWRMFGATGRAQLFLACHREKPIAAILNTIAGGRMYYGWGGMDRDPAHRKLMANYLLHFGAMQWARVHGCTHYDLVGVTEFKEKLGRDEIRWPLPLRKHYGATGGLRKAITEFFWSNTAMRRTIDAIARRTKLRPRLPY
jgi:lipid II:glycine glycyltransferase (peptidoglycan interpeptide bridge formation enzyme)